MDEEPASHFHLLNEESSITGGKSVSEIVQILRTNANLKLKARDFDEDFEDQPSKASHIFPWLKKFTAQCREIIPEPDIKKLDELISAFLKHIEDSVKECYKRPKRAHTLKTRMFSFLQVFHMIYGQLKQPLEHTSYLDKMSDVMALFIDIELKSSRRGREHPKKISERICSSLFIFLDKSIDHILDTVLKAKFFIKKYSDICCPIMARLLKEKPGPMYETSYVRYLLSFKLWKKLAGKDHYQSINKEAVAKLIPPPDFAEKLKSGLFSNVLPYLNKSERDRITLFFMQSPFNVKKKAQVFLKDEKKINPNLDLEKSPLFDDDLQITSFFDEDSNEESNQPNVLMNDIWRNLVDKEDDCFDSLFISLDIIEQKDDDENIIVDLIKTKTKDKSRKLGKEKATNGVVKTTLKKRKALKVNRLKNISSKDVMDLIKNELTKPISNTVMPKEELSAPFVKVEEHLPSLHTTPEQKQSKPCAAIEPEQCKEVTDSNITEIPLIKLSPSVPTTSCMDEAQREAVINLVEEQLHTIETSVPGRNAPPELAVVSPSVSTNNHCDSATVDSSGISEGVKAENLTKEYFDDLPESYKISKPDDAKILEENFIAEEVVISSDMEQDASCTFLYLETDGRIDQADIMNVIGISRDSSDFCSNEVVVQSETQIKEPNKEQRPISSLLMPQNNSLNITKTKDSASVSPENQFLSSIIASSETNEAYVSLYPRQDSYNYNEMLLHKLFCSDPSSVDDGSDDDSRYQNHRRLTSGGKVGAFRKHLEETKSDNDDDFEAFTPSSDSQQQSPLDTSPDLMSLQAATNELSPPEFDTGLKNSPNPVGEEISSHSDDISEKKLSQQEHGQIKELSVHLSRGDMISANEHILNKEKISPKGMCEPPDITLHFNSIEADQNYRDYLLKLCSLYNALENILETDPVRYPPDKVISYPVIGYFRCPCFHCTTNFMNLHQDYNFVRDLRNSKIISYVDKKRYLKSLFENKVEDDKLLKYVEDNIALKSSEKQKPEKDGLTVYPHNEGITEVDTGKPMLTKNENSSSEPQEAVSQVTEIDKKLEYKESDDKKNEYVSLPPKKRRAFNVELDSSDSSKDSCKRPKIDQVSKNIKSKPNEQNKSNCVSISLNQKEKHHNGNPDSFNESKKGTSESSNRFSPVKIKAVDGSYCVLSETSTTNGRSVGNMCVSNDDIPSVKKKCHRKRSKQERRARKEEKRLKKLKKLEESLNK